MKKITRDRLIAALEKNPSFKDEVLEHFIGLPLVKLLGHPEAREMILSEAEHIYGAMAEEISPGDPWNEWVRAGGTRPPKTKTCGPWVEIRGADGQVIHWAREGYKGETIAEVRYEGGRTQYSGRHLPDWTWTAHMLDPSDAPKVDIGYDGPEEEYEIGRGNGLQDAMNKADEQLKKWGWVFKDADEWVPRGDWFMGRSATLYQSDLDILEQRIVAAQMQGSTPPPVVTGRQPGGAKPVLTPPRPDKVAGDWKPFTHPSKECYQLPGTNTVILATVTEQTGGFTTHWHWKTVGGFEGHCGSFREAKEKVGEIMKGMGYA